MVAVDFRALPLGANVALFAAAAIGVWLAGARLAGYADAIANRTNLSRVFLGVVMLGIATSLPEIATTLTAAVIGSAGLVAGNLFGGVSLQIAVLAIVDLVAVRGGPLTYFTPQPVLLFQGVMLLLLLAVALAGIAAGEPLTLMGVGLTPVLLMGGYILMVRLSQGGDYLPRWQATHRPVIEPAVEESGAGLRETSTARIYVFSGASALVILAAGWTLAQAGDALAQQTGLGATFVGVALVAGSTSLPELSTTLGAVRHGNHQMAVSSVLGTNCLEVALFLLADAAYRGGPILAVLDRSALFAGALGMIVTCVFLLGLLERRDRTVLGMGLDSAVVLGVYTCGIAGLYWLR